MAFTEEEEAKLKDLMKLYDNSVAIEDLPSASRIDPNNSIIEVMDAANGESYCATLGSLQITFNNWEVTEEPNPDIPISYGPDLSLVGLGAFDTEEYSPTRLSVQDWEGFLKGATIGDKLKVTDGGYNPIREETVIYKENYYDDACFLMTVRNDFGAAKICTYNSIGYPRYLVPFNSSMKAPMAYFTGGSVDCPAFEVCEGGDIALDDDGNPRSRQIEFAGLMNGGFIGGEVDAIEPGSPVFRDNRLAGVVAAVAKGSYPLVTVIDNGGNTLRFQTYQHPDGNYTVLEDVTHKRFISRLADGNESLLSSNYELGDQVEVIDSDGNNERYSVTALSRNSTAPAGIGSITLTGEAGDVQYSLIFNPYSPNRYNRTDPEVPAKYDYYATEIGECCVELPESQELTLENVIKQWVAGSADPDRRTGFTETICIADTVEDENGTTATVMVPLGSCTVLSVAVGSNGFRQMAVLVTPRIPAYPVAVVVVSWDTLQEGGEWQWRALNSPIEYTLPIDANTLLSVTRTK